MVVPEPIKWLLAVEGHAKHRQWQHPVVAAVLGVGVVLYASVVVQELLFPTSLHGFDSEDAQVRGRQLGQALACYTAFMCALRMPDMGLAAVGYEVLWSCNLGMLLAALGFWSGRPQLVGAAVCTVAIDQILWYVDLVGYLVSGKWVVGVAKYMTWESTTWKRRLSSSHHLWFMPLCVRAIGGVRASDYALSLAGGSNYLTVLVGGFCKSLH